MTSIRQYIRRFLIRRSPRFALGAERLMVALLWPLHRLLLFKLDSHRVSVIAQEELFPIEWRIDAERTILPWDLPEQLSAWQGYRDEVGRGMHQAYLRELYIYVQIHGLVTVEVENLTSVVRSSLTATGSWARRRFCVRWSVAFTTVPPGA